MSLQLQMFLLRLVLLEFLFGRRNPGCEVKAGAALIASARLFFSAIRKEMFYSEDAWRVVVVAYRQDATNSKLKQVHMELECGVLCSSDVQVQDPLSHELMGAQTFCCLSDCIPVEEGTGLATVGMSLKMLESVGCPTWRELAARQSDLRAKFLDTTAQAQADTQNHDRRDGDSVMMSKSKLQEQVAEQCLGSFDFQPLGNSNLHSQSPLDPLGFFRLSCAGPFALVTRTLVRIESDVR